MLPLVENAACGQDIAQRQELIGGKLSRLKASLQSCTLEFANLHKTRECGGN